MFFTIIVLIVLGFRSGFLASQDVGYFNGFADGGIRSKG